MSDQKYRQHGYRDGQEPRREDRPQPKPKDVTFGPRSVHMAPSRTVSRCAQCGVILNAQADPAGKCPQCGAALHACKQCTYFDPGSHFECRQPVTARIAKKDLANECNFFTLRTRVEKETSTAASRSDDARRAFENLFKK